MEIGIVGNGFVGNAINEGFKNHYNMIVYDKNPQKSPNILQELYNLKYIFICVPTPMDNKGNLDLSIVKAAIKELGGHKTLIIKSTITPAGALDLIKSFSQHTLVFNPEFLTERTAVEDFKNPSRIVLGGDPEAVNHIFNIYERIFPDTYINYILTDAKTACFIKYFCNCFFAAKISLINEFKQTAEIENIDWPVALGGLLSSGWVNHMHTQCPGPDGKKGFGGKCFPKDLNAFIEYSKSLGISPLMLEAAWEKNLEVRINSDWLAIPGVVNGK
jgi:UDPglucose 6-dehydrogenase